MEETIIIIALVVFFFLIYTSLYSWYTPKIEIIIFDDRYEVYLWYNQWIDSEYFKRTRTLLLSANKKETMKWLKFTVWVISSMLLPICLGKMLYIANTAANIAGLLIAVIYVVLSIKTRCFTTINLINNKKKKQFNT